jgi:hypothetical protein
MVRGELTLEEQQQTERLETPNAPGAGAVAPAAARQKMGCREMAAAALQVCT